VRLLGDLQNRLNLGVHHILGAEAELERRTRRDLFRMDASCRNINHRRYLAVRYLTEDARPVPRLGAGVVVDALQMLTHGADAEILCDPIRPSKASWIA
jgi:hypothetical protein